MDIRKLNVNGKLKIPSAPLMFFLDLTEICNLNCWFCYNSYDSKRKHADYDNIIKILNIMHGVGCVEVTYLGGEPTLHPRFFDILAYAESLGMSQCIISNGQVIDNKFAEKLAKYNNIEVGISIHSDIEYVQNKIACNEKSFKNIEKAITSIEEQGLSWYSQTSLIKTNYLYLDRLRKYLLCKGKPTRMDLSRMVVNGYKTGEFLNEEDYVKVFKQVNEFDTDELPVRIEAFPRCWLYQIASKNGLNYLKLKKAVRPCYAWISQISIDISGNVRLCPTGGKLAGNILNSSFEDIWKNESAIKDFQSFKWQRRECLECKDFAFCVGACKMTCCGVSPTPDNYIIKGGLNNASNN